MSQNHGIPTDDVTCGHLVKHSLCITYVPTFDVHVYKATAHKDIRLIGEWSVHEHACLLPLELHSHMHSALPDWVNLWNTLQASSILPNLAYLSTRLLPTWTFDSQPLWVTCVCMPLASSCALEFAHTLSTQTEVRLSGAVILFWQILLLFQPKTWENLGTFCFSSVNLTKLAIFGNFSKYSILQNWKKKPWSGGFSCCCTCWKSDRTTAKNLRKTHAKVFPPSFSGLPWIDEISYNLMGTAIRLSSTVTSPVYIQLSTSIWTIKSCLNAQKIEHYGSSLIHKIKQLRMQYKQTVIHNYCALETKEDCSWNHIVPEDGHHKWFVYLQISTHLLTWERTCWKISCLRGSSPVALTRTCHVHLIVSTSSEKIAWSPHSGQHRSCWHTSRSNSNLQDCRKKSTPILWR